MTKYTREELIEALDAAEVGSELTVYREGRAIWAATKGEDVKWPWKGEHSRSLTERYQPDKVVLIPAAALQQYAVEVQNAAD